MPAYRSSPPSSWHSILDAAKAGNRDAMGKLLQTHWGPLWMHAKGQIDESLQGKQAASDLVQETFLDAQRCLQDFRGNTQGELHAWLKAILANNIRDVWRQFSVSQKRQVSLEMPIAAAEQIDIANRAESSSPSAQFQKNERIVAVQRVMDELPEHYATVIRLRHWDVLSFETIAIKMNKSPEAVRQLWYRALQLFTEQVQSHDGR